MERSFDAVWKTLGLEDATIPEGSMGLLATMRRATASPGGPSLPLLSVRALGAHTPGDSSSGAPDISVTGVLGEGGMGRVLLAYQRSLRREVAVKTVFPGASEQERGAVLSEGFVTGHLEHPNIIPVHELGTDTSGAPLLVMKRVIGVDWDQLLANEDHPAWQRIPSARGVDRLGAHLEILMQVAQALAYAHGRGVVHRDIKPENVMIGTAGEVYLVDWGVALMLGSDEPHALMGTPAFMAPEMVDAALEVGPWTDVYLLGATLHAVLTGRPRHEGATMHAVLLGAHQSRPVVYPAAVPEELADLCNQATARDPARRPASALAFHQALASYRAHAGSLALAAVADERLAELTAALADAGSRDDPRTARLAAECRFGHLMALRDWEDNPRARRGLRAVLERVVELEVARDNAPAARVALAELQEALERGSAAETVPDHLTQAVARVEQRHEGTTRARDELARVRHDQDVGVAVRQRTALIATFILLIIGLTGALALRRGNIADGIATPLSVAGGASLALVLALVGVLVGRRWLLRNAMNRQFAAALVGIIAVLVVHRLLGLRAGAPVADTLRGDMFICAAATGIFALHSSRHWFVGAGLMLAGAITSTFRPRLSELLFPVCAVLLFAIGAYGWRKQDA